jgi:hypothetical protein
MTVYSSHAFKASVQGAVVLAGLMATGCVPRYTTPSVVQASNPSITYQYHNDAELLQANQSAATYCSQYQAVPRTAHIDQGPDSRVVVFECVQGVAGPGPVSVTGPTVLPGSLAYSGYYDDFYGPFYDGYWAADGYFYFTDGPGHAFRRDDYHHFRRDMAAGFHGVRGSGVHAG